MYFISGAGGVFSARLSFMTELSMLHNCGDIPHKFSDLSRSEGWDETLSLDCNDSPMTMQFDDVKYEAIHHEIF